MPLTALTSSALLAWVYFIVLVMLLCRSIAWVIRMSPTIRCIRVAAVSRNWCAVAVDPHCLSAAAMVEDTETGWT
jgi:hypothetical protein